MKELRQLFFQKFKRGDIDGFFGLFIDNLLQLMLIALLCNYACGFPHEFITTRILPGAAFSIFFGNIYYAWQAQRLAKQTGRRNVTALPFGINTISLMAFIFLIMSPVYNDTGDWELAWKVGLAACFVSGIIEIAGAYVGDWLKRHTPRAALLSGLAGVALTFIVLGFSFQIFSSPLIAVIPMFIVLICYGARLRLPFHIPGGLLAILIGVGIAWALRLTGVASFTTPGDPWELGFYFPIPVVGDLFSILTSSKGWAYISVVAPIGLFNVIGSIQNLESAEAAGDKFSTKPSMLVNGITSLFASFFGSPFPTTIYIGHPGWKSMGAGTGYSVLSGTAIAIICLIGGITGVLTIIPLEATLGILIWIGIVIVAESFERTDRKYAIAVVLGLIPVLGTWALHLIESCLHVVGTSLYEAYDYFAGEIFIDGILSLYQGFLMTSIILASIMTYIIDRKFLKAAAWSAVAAILSAVGLIHSFELTPSGIHNSFGLMAEPWFFSAYGILTLIFIALHKRALFN